MATAPSGDKTLTPDDAMKILEKILPAQNRSYELGLKLMLPNHEVKGIHSMHTEPQTRLLHVILAFLNQAEPRPTWRVIVDALRSPAINLPRLADQLEATHFPDPTSTRDVVTETTPTASVQAASPSQKAVVDLPETEEASTSTSVPGPPDTTESSAAATTSGTTATTSTPATPSTANVLMPLSVNSVRRDGEDQPNVLLLKGQSSKLKTHTPTVKCRAKKDARCKMIKGSATTDQQYAYFTPQYSTSVYSYEWNTEQWKKLPSCKYCDSALVIIDGELTTVGGWKKGCTNKLFTLRQGQWVEEYPSMKTGRSKPAVVSTPDGDYIIVIGGWDGDIDAVTAVVELFQVKTRQWYELTDLPQPLSFPSATICGNQVHVIGGDGNGYSCSLQASDEPQSLPDLISWTPLPPLPVTHSTAATLSGKLVLIGGKRHRSRVRSRVNSIHQLVEGQWVEIHSMTSSRWGCLSVSPSPDTVIIVGGWGAEHTVEEYFVS